MPSKMPLESQVETEVGTPIPEEVAPATSGTQLSDAAPTQLTPEQDEQLSLFVANALKMVHTPQSTDSILAEIKASPNKGVALGKISEQIVERLESEAETNGVKIDAVVSIIGALKILDELVTISKGTKAIQDFTEEDAKIAVGQFVGQYFENAIGTGRMKKEELVALGREYAKDEKLRVEEPGMLEQAQAGGK